MDRMRAVVQMVSVDGTPLSDAQTWDVDCMTVDTSDTIEETAEGGWIDRREVDGVVRASLSLSRIHRAPQKDDKQ